MFLCVAVNGTITILHVRIICSLTEWQYIYFDSLTIWIMAVWICELNASTQIRSAWKKNIHIESCPEIQSLSSPELWHGSLDRVDQRCCIELETDLTVICTLVPFCIRITSKQHIICCLHIYTHLYACSLCQSKYSTYLKSRPDIFLLTS